MTTAPAQSGYLQEPGGTVLGDRGGSVLDDHFHHAAVQHHQYRQGSRPMSKWKAVQHSEHEPFVAIPEYDVRMR